MQLGITIPLQKYLKLPKQSYGEPEELFFCWEVHKVRYQGCDTLVAVNANNRFAIILSGIKASEWKELPKLVEEGIEAGMCTEGYSKKEIDAYFNIAGPAILTKTHGRKPVAGLNMAIECMNCAIEPLSKGKKYQPGHCWFVNRDICSPSGFDTYDYPETFFRRDMERVGIIKNTKIIKFPIQ